ncbi:MAG: hypothetical protein IKJ06_02405 [Clostridia bacterium]|nr:hypothetical protein [Clostridia bacterium]
MKKYIIIVSAIIALILLFDFAYYHLGWYIPFGNDTPKCFVKTDDKNILVKQEGKFIEFEIKGVNLGSAIPGEWPLDYAIDDTTYLRWFRQIQEMGANTIRVYGVQSDTFYKAFYSYNKNNQNPLYLIQGVLINDYVQFSHRDAFDDEFIESFTDNARTAVDVIHGRKKIQFGRKATSASGSFTLDVSDWVIGYILGIDWEPSTVAYTNEKYKASNLSYKGKYMYAKDGAAPFEIMLATVGDKMIEYESNKYETQRLIAFSNHPGADPFTYPEDVARLYQKYAEIDIENIVGTDKFISGQFASYHVYPFQTDLLKFLQDFGGIEPCYNEDGSFNDYRTYFAMLNFYHSCPVVISEFGISSGRGVEHEAKDGDGIYSQVSEKEQGKALADCWEDIKAAGLNGGCVYSWQDEWARRTWNTLYAINEERSPYWSDYQTNGQYFGLLSFDPGEEKSVCYVDGNISEWDEEDVVIKGNLELSIKYDEKFVYFLIKKKNLDFSNDIIYIPIDLTQKTGSNYCKNLGVKFDREADFLLVINGSENSRLIVQERYEALRSTYSRRINGFDTYRQENIPPKNSPEFVLINTIVEKKVLSENPLERNIDILVETGKLLYGNANPESPDFNSLADFISNGDYIEVKIPWQLLNFSDPSKMEIHDDYYDGNYGVKNIKIDGMYVGVGFGNGRVAMEKVKLEGWANTVTYYERLKSSYYVMQGLWKAGVKK